MARQPRTLVLLEDPCSTRVESALARAGHAVRLRSRADLLPEVSTFRPDLVILDLPEGDPSALQATVRRTHASCRPLVLCAVDGPEQWVPALEAGADAYLQKPFDDHELEVSVGALLRRVPWFSRSVHCIGGLVVDEPAHVALVDGALLALGKKDFGILAMLARNPGQVVSKRALLEQVWGYDAYDENLVEVHVCSLRRRLPPSGRRLIQTVRGMGYVLREDCPQDVSASCTMRGQPRRADPSRATLRGR